MVDILRYNIWQHKLNKTNLSFFTIENEFLDQVNTYATASRKIFSALTTCPLIILDGSGEDGQAAGGGVGAGLAYVGRP
jgi:hypothetical protein